MDRVIALIDMDCFYVQVEQRDCPDKRGHPCAVVQYKVYKGGGIIAVNYEAKALGVKRGMMGYDARKACPSVHLFRVPESRGKADLTRYREAGAEVIRVLVNGQVGCVERASIDEAYVDLTDEVQRRLNVHGFSVLAQQLPNTVVAGFETAKEGEAEDRPSSAALWLRHINDANSSDTDGDKALAVGAMIVEELRAAIKDQTSFQCSAGVAHNKVMAKLACGMNKPNRQTVLPHSSVHHVFTTTPICDVRSFGGKFGEFVMEKLGVEFMADLCRFTESELQARLGERATIGKLTKKFEGVQLSSDCKHDYPLLFAAISVSSERLVYQMVPAVSDRAVEQTITQSVGCSKNFLGKEILNTREKIQYWLSQLALEVCDRLVKDRETNRRVARSITLTLTHESFPVRQSASRCFAVTRYDAKKFTDDAFAMLQQFNTAPANQPAWSPAVLHLGLVAGKFVDHSDKSAGSLRKFIAQAQEKSAKALKGDDNETRSNETHELSTEDTTTYGVRAADGEAVDESQVDVISDAKNEDATVGVSAIPESTTASPVKSVTSAYGVRSSSSSSQLMSFIAACKAKVAVTPATTAASEKILNSDSVELADCPRDTEDIVKCEHCGIGVSAWDLPEHLDWHVAVDLQNEERALSRQPTGATAAAATAAAVASERGAGSSKKRKASSATSKAVVDAKKSVGNVAGIKKLSSFFSPTNR